MTDSEIKHTFNKFAGDTKLSGAADMPEGQGAIQRDLDRLEKWACVNLMRFNKAKCRVLYLGRDNPRHQYRLRDEGIESSPEEQDLRILAGEKLDIIQQCALTVQKANHIPGSHQEKHRQQVKGGDSAPLFCSGETSPGVLHPALEPSAQEGHGAVGAGPEEGHKNGQGARAPLLQGKAETWR